MKTKDEVKKYLPKDKFDNYYIDHMLELTSNEIEPIIVDLLVWLKDMNLPVTKEIVPVLIKNEEVVRPVIIEILVNEKEDSILKYNIINRLISNFDNSSKVHYKDALTRIAKKPTSFEIRHETSLLAQNLLSEI